MITAVVVLAVALLAGLAVRRVRGELRAIDERIAAFNAAYPRDWDIRELVPDRYFRKGDG